MLVLEEDAPLFPNKLCLFGADVFIPPNILDRKYCPGDVDCEDKLIS